MIRLNHLPIITNRLSLTANQIAFDHVLKEGDLLRREDYAQRMQRKASVLVPLCNVDNEASVVFTIRSTTLNTHRGQVAFPGGHVDVGETLIQAALRELKEETALDAIALGQWKDARAITGTMVTPVVGIICTPNGEIRNLTHEQVKQAGTVAPDEVSGAFSLPIKRLCDPLLGTRRTEILGAGTGISRFRSLRFEFGPEPVWGLTAFFLRGILIELAPVLDLQWIETDWEITSSSSTQQ
jgi:nudix motif 8